MSADFSKILVKDDRLEVVDNIKYAVIKGGQNVTAAQFQAISKTDSQIVFNIQVPSEQTLIDRRVLLQADFTLLVSSAIPSVTAAAVGASACSFNGANSTCGYGVRSSLAPYPLHQMMTVASATINNNTVSINIRDVLPAIQRLVEERELSSFNGTTPTYTDPLYSYSDCIGSLNNPLAGQFTSADPDFNGRGTIALTAYEVVTAGGAGVAKVESFSFHISEPLMISPFIYSNPSQNGQAFYGIQNMNIVLNIGNLSRVFRGLQGVNGFAGSDAATTTVTGYVAGTVFPSPGLDPVVAGGNVAVGVGLPVITGVAAPAGGLFQTAKLLFMFLTPHPSDLMPARNIVPFYELPRYITTGLPTVPALVKSVDAVASKAAIAPTGGYVVPYSTTGGTSLTSQTLQLNQIPDKLIIMVRKQIGTQSFGDSDSYLPIRGININFNNNSGILASATCEDLYRMTKDNCSNQNWQQWLGLTNTILGSQAVGGSNISLGPVNALSTVAPTLNIQKFAALQTCGSVLVLEFGKDIQLVEDFFAPGSLGNFNIQVQVRCENQMCADAGSSTGQIPIEMVMVTMNSGVFVCERGTSSTYTGILTRADVLEASEQDAYTRSDVQRMVGGSFHDMIKSGVSKLAPLVKAAAPHVLPHVEKYVKGKLGMGRSGAGIGMGIGSGSAGNLSGRYH